MKPELKELVRKSLFVTPLPFVKTVIFISTPQHGSYVSEGRIAKWLAGMVQLEDELISNEKEFVQAVAANDPDKAALMRNLPRSVNNMDPSDLFMKTLASIRVARPSRPTRSSPCWGANRGKRTTTGW